MAMPLQAKSTEQESGDLQFGAIVYLELKDSLQKEDQFLCSDGFVIKYVFAHKIDDPSIDFSNGLFVVTPAYNQDLLSKLSDLNISKLRQNNMLDDKESLVRTIENLEYEIKLEMQKFNKLKNAPLVYGQPFMLQHQLSSRFLSFKAVQQHIFFVENTLALEVRDIPSEQCIFSIRPAHSYQSEISKKVHFNDEIILKCSYFEKEASLFWSGSQIENDEESSQASDVDSDSEQSHQDKNNQQDVFMSYDYHSILKIQKYSDSVTEADKHVQYGDIAWLFHYERDGYLAYDDVFEEFEQFFIQTIMERLETQEKLKTNFSLLKPQQPIGTPQDDSECLHLERAKDSFVKNTLGMWKIENVSKNQGGVVGSQDRIRLRALRTGRYLAIMPLREKAAKKLDFSQQEEEDFIVTLTKLPDDWTEFELVLRGKGKEIIPTYASFFNLRSVKTQTYLKTIPGHELEEDGHYAYPAVRKECNQSDVFRFFKATETEVWETHFLRGCLPILQCNIKYLRKLKNDDHLGIAIETNPCDTKINAASKTSLLILKTCLFEIKQFSSESKHEANNTLMSSDRPSLNPISFRQKLLREQGFLHLLTNILQSLFTDPEAELERIFLSNPQKGTRLHRKAESSLTINAILSRPSVLIRQNSSNFGLSQTQSIMGKDAIAANMAKNNTLFQEICELCYDCIGQICRNNHLCQLEAYKFFDIYIRHVGLGLGAERCMRYILHGNETLLLSVHKDTIKPATIKRGETLENNLPQQQTEGAMFSSFSPTKLPKGIQLALFRGKSQKLSNKSVPSQKFSLLKRISSKKVNMPLNQLVSQNTIVHAFMERYAVMGNLIEEKFYYKPMLDFFNTLTKSNKSGISINQMLIANLVEKNREEQQGKSRFIIPIELRNNGEIFLEIFEDQGFQFKELSEVLVEYDLKQDTQFISYLKAQINLYSNLCYGRNYYGKRMLKELFPTSSLLKYMVNYQNETIQVERSNLDNNRRRGASFSDISSENISLVNNLIAEFVSLLLRLHIDSKPRNFRPVPNLFFKSPKMEEINPQIQVSSTFTEINRENQSIPLINVFRNQSPSPQKAPNKHIHFPQELNSTLDPLNETLQLQIEQTPSNQISLKKRKELAPILIKRTQVAKLPMPEPSPMKENIAGFTFPEKEGILDEADSVSFEEMKELKLYLIDYFSKIEGKLFRRQGNDALLYQNVKLLRKLVCFEEFRVEKSTDIIQMSPLKNQKPQDSLLSKIKRNFGVQYLSTSQPMFNFYEMSSLKERSTSFTFLRNQLIQILEHVTSSSNTTLRQTKKREPLKHSNLTDKSVITGTSDSMMNVMQTLFQEVKKKKQKQNLNRSRNSNVNSEGPQCLVQMQLTRLKSLIMSPGFQSKASNKIRNNIEDPNINDENTKQISDVEEDDDNVSDGTKIRKEVVKCLLDFMAFGLEKHIQEVLEICSAIRGKIDQPFDNLLTQQLNLIFDKIEETILDRFPDSVLQNNNNNSEVKALHVILLSQILDSSDYAHSLQCLKLLHVHFSQKQLIAKSLRKVVLITNNADGNAYESLQRFGGQLKLLSDTSEMWLHSPEEFNRIDYEFYSIGQEYIKTIHSITNLLDESVPLHDVTLPFKFKQASPLRQKMMENLQINETLITFLKSNFFYIENNKGFIEQKDASTPKASDTESSKPDQFLSVFALTFHVLRMFCKQNLVGKKRLFTHINTLIGYLFQVEVGQLPLIAEIYSQNAKALCKLSQSFIDVLIQKVIQGNYHPKYINYMLKLINIDDEILRKKTTETLLNSLLEFSKNLSASFFMKEKIEIVENDEASDGFVDTQIKNSIEKELDFQVNIEKNRFPYLYHSKLFELFSLLLEQIPGKSTFLKNILKDSLPADYLWKLIKKPDIYSENKKHSKLHLSLNTFLKTKVMKLLNLLYLSGQNKQNFNRITNHRVFIERETNKLKKYLQRNNKKIKSRAELSKLNISVPNDSSPDKLPNQFSNPIISTKYKSIIQDHDFQESSYIVYVIDDLLPFLFGVCSNHSNLKGGDQSILQLIKDLLDFLSTMDSKEICQKAGGQEIILKLYRSAAHFSEFNYLSKFNVSLASSRIITDSDKDYSAIFPDLHSDTGWKSDQNKIFAVKNLTTIQEGGQQKSEEILSLGDVFENLSAEAQTLIQSLPLSNILAARKSDPMNYDRNDLLEIVISDKIEQSIKKERNEFVSVYKQLDMMEFFISKKKPSLEVIWRFCSFIIDGTQKCMMLIEQNFQSNLESENMNIRVIIEYIKICKDILSEIEDERDKNKMQVLMNKDSLLVSSIMEFICSKHFELIDSEHTLFFFCAIELFNQLLDGGNRDVQSSFYEFFRTKPPSCKFFQIINDIVKSEIYQMSIGTSDDLNNINLRRAFKNIKYSYQRKSKVYRVQSIFRFVQLLCENHNSFLQLWLRQQKNSRMNVDILKLILQYLQAVMKKNNQQLTNLNINRKNISTIIQCFDTLTEMIQGPCIENQIALTEESFIELAYDILSMDDKVSTTEASTISETKKRRIDSGNGVLDLSNQSRLQQVQSFFFKQSQRKKKEIESEVFGYLRKISDKFATRLEKAFKMHHDSQLWMISRVKFKCFQTIESMLEGNTNNFILRKMMSIIPIEYLKLNLLQVYSNFKVEEKCSYNMELFNESLTHSITQLEPENIVNKKVTVIESGFKIYYLISKYEHEQNGISDLQEPTDEADEEEEESLLKNVFRGTQNIFKPFFRGIRRLIRSNILREVEGSLERNLELSQELYEQAMHFFSKYVCRIEILRDEKFYQVHFPKLPYCEYLTEQTKDQFQEKVNRMSLNSKLRDLMTYCEDILDQLRNEYTMMKQYERIYLFIYIAKNYHVFQNLSFYLAITQNIMILLISQESGNISKQFQGIFQQEQGTLSSVLFGCQIIQVALGGLLVVFFTFKVIRLKFKKAQKYLREREGDQQTPLHTFYIYLKYILLDFYVVYYLAQSGIGILGILNPIFSVFLLADVFRKYPSAKSVMLAIITPWKQLVVIMFIWLILTYLFSLLYFFNLSEDYPNSCSNLYKCTFMILDLTFKSDAGFVGSRSVDYEDGWTPNWKILADFTYAFVVTILVIQIIQGIIIDTFAQLRQQQEERMKDMETCCFICGKDRESLDKEGETVSQGFDFHIKNIHNLWCYFFYIAYILNKPETECTGLESYVRQSINNDSSLISWFPTSRVHLEGEFNQSQMEQREARMEKRIDQLSMQLAQIQAKFDANSD